MSGSLIDSHYDNMVNIGFFAESVTIILMRIITNQYKRISATKEQNNNPRKTSHLKFLLKVLHVFNYHIDCKILHRILHQINENLPNVCLFVQ